MKTSTESLAQQLGCELVNTRSTQGHPNGTHFSITGFFDYEEAKTFADHVNGEVVLLHKAPGENIYTNKGCVTEGIDILSMYNDNNDVKVYTSVSDFEKDALADIASRIQEGTDLLLVSMLSQRMTDTFYELCDELGDDETFAVVNRCNWNVEKILSTHVTHLDKIDGSRLVIAVIDNETDDDIENDND